MLQGKLRQVEHRYDNAREKLCHMEQSRSAFETNWLQDRRLNEAALTIQKVYRGWRFRALRKQTTLSEEVYLCTTRLSCICIRCL